LEAAILNLQYFYQAIDKSYNSIGNEDEDDDDGDDYNNDDDVNDYFNDDDDDDDDVNNDNDDDVNDYNNDDDNNNDDNDDYHDNISDNVDSCAASDFYYLLHRECYVFKNHFISYFLLFLANKLISQQSARNQLLTKFEASLLSLKEIPLQAQIKEAIYKFYLHYCNTDQAQMIGGSSNTSDGSSSSSSDGSSSSSSSYFQHIFQGTSSIDSIGTLYECIPVDREKKFLSECIANHAKVGR
jgi:hypothetical protein